MKMINGWKNIVCGISGGVDSAVAAILLKKQGYNVVGLFMKNWDIVDERGFCSAETDFEDAQIVCNHLKIPLHRVDFVKEYWNRIFSSFLQDYQRGFTPNPDILCNKYIKFDAFLQHAINELGADAIATGHYAQISRHAESQGNQLSTTGAKLLKSIDPVKDQTFFLSQISQQSLQNTLFPVGHLKKEEVKQIAQSHGLHQIAKKKESMGICFIGSRKFQTFIKEYIEPRPGNFVDVETGQVVGQHQGIHFWTLGQRTNLGGHPHAYFVAEINPYSQEIIVASGTKHPALFSSSFTVEQPHWIHSPPTVCNKGFIRVDFRFQHTHPLIPCKIETSGSNGSSYLVSLPQPMRAISPGQYAVFYTDNQCLGSAQIEEVGPSLWRQNKRDLVQLPKQFS